MSNPFEIAGQLSTSKTDHWDDIDEKEYVSFMINRTFSYHHDTLMIANVVNKMHTAPKRWQYDMLRLAVNPKRKRFAKWAKPEEDKLVELIANTYQVNRHRAISIRKLLNSNDINTLKELTNRGGR